MHRIAHNRMHRLALGVAAVIACAFVAISQSAGSRGSAQAAPTAASVQEAEAENVSYGVLARPADADDERFAQSSVALRETSERDPQLGLEPDGARVVRSDAAGTLAVVPAEAAPCLVSESSSSRAVSCGTPEHPTTAQVRYGSATGVVPDSVSTVSFKMTDGSSVRRAVTNNLWEAPADAASATIVVDGHSTVVELMPRTALPEGATVGPHGLVTIGKPDPNYRG